AVGRTQDARARFLREARAAGGLQHRNIVTIYDLGEADGQLFIALELVDGRDLSQLIAGEEPLPLERRLDIAIDVLQGLAYAHGRGVIHRDIQPSNVRTPGPKPLRAIVPSLPLALDRVVAKALNKVPEDRYENARHMQSALASIRAALSGASEPTARLAPRWTPLPDAALRLVTHMSLKWRAAVLTALMVTALVLLYVSRSPSPVAAPLSTDATATLDQLLAYPLPTGLNGALTAQRDSALAARDRAHRAGAMKNNV